MRSCCVADSPDEVKPECCGASSQCCLPRVCWKRAIIFLHLCPGKWNWQLMSSIAELDKQSPVKHPERLDLRDHLSTHCTFALLSCCLTSIVSAMGTTTVIHWHSLSPGTSPNSVGLFLPAFSAKQDGGLLWWVATWILSFCLHITQFQRCSFP